MDSRGLTKIQSAALIAVIIVAAISVSVAYVLWSANQPPPENIRIGVFGSLDTPIGKIVWQGATLAAEQINAQGGILGRNVTIVAEDQGSSGDIADSTAALTKLITVDKADYIITAGSLYGRVVQDVCATHKKIQISVGSSDLNYTQRVLDDYEKYKYFFRVLYPNSTAVAANTIDTVLTLRNYTGFNKLACLMEDSPTVKQTASMLKASAVEHGFEVVYFGFAPAQTTDFTSYMAAIDASGAEILFPLFSGQAGIPLAKEWYDRQSPFVMWGEPLAIAAPGVWNLTEGRCDTVSFTGQPVDAGYPLTSRILPFREAFYDRWGATGTSWSGAAYDVVRFILPDAIKRGGTTETDAVIKALEKTDVETTLARHFVFTSSHDVMVGSAGVKADYMLICKFQWQNGTQVPVYPKWLMEEAGVTYKFPNWAGPWDRIQAP